MKKWLKLILVLAVFAVISVTLFIILNALNITDLNTLQNIILNTGNYGIFVFIIIQVVMLVCFCFVPIINAALVVMGIIIFGPIKAYISCMIAIMFSSSILFFLGDKFGEKLARKLIGEDELNRVQDLIDVKSKILLPLSFLIPGFPDEAFCIVAGMTKMKYWYFILINVLCHAVEIGLICFFGSSLIDWSSLSLIHWIMLVNLVVVDLYLLFKLDKFITNKAKFNKK